MRRTILAAALLIGASLPAFAQINIGAPPVAPAAGPGSGDVVGPASATNNSIAAFNGTTGKLLKDGGILTSAIIVSGGPLGTPSSGVATNLTGLPLTTGVTGILPGANGGTGVANTGKTITLGGNLVTAGAFATTLTVTGTTTLTLPTTGTLATRVGAETLTNKTINGSTITGYLPLTGGTLTDELILSKAGNFSRPLSIISSALADTEVTYFSLGKAVSSDNAFFVAYTHNATAANRYLSIQPFESSIGSGFVAFATGNIALGSTTDIGRKLYVNGSAQITGLYNNEVVAILRSSVTITGGGTANVPTMTTGPVTGNPTKWLPYDDNGTTRYIPSW